MNRRFFYYAFPRYSTKPTIQEEISSRPVQFFGSFNCFLTFFYDYNFLVFVLLCSTIHTNVIIHERTRMLAWKAGLISRLNKFLLARNLLKGKHWTLAATSFTRTLDTSSRQKSSLITEMGVSLSGLLLLFMNHLNTWLESRMREIARARIIITSLMAVDLLLPVRDSIELRRAEKTTRWIESVSVWWFDCRPYYVKNWPTASSSVEILATFG